MVRVSGSEIQTPKIMANKNTKRKRHLSGHGLKRGRNVDSARERELSGKKPASLPANKRTL